MPTERTQTHHRPHREMQAEVTMMIEEDDDGVSSSRYFPHTVVVDTIAQPATTALASGI